MKNKWKMITVLSITIMLFITVGTTLIIHSQKQDEWNNPTQTNQQKTVEEIPIVDFNTFESANPEEREIRRQRGNRYKTRTPLEKMEDQNAVFEILPSHSPTEPAFPVEQSSLIIWGLITDAQAFISTDKTAVYSEFQIKVKEILKNNKDSISPESNIVADRIGGRVRFPSGRIQMRGDSGRSLPQKNKQYILFLKWEEEGKVYSILTGYELNKNKVNPLDGLNDDSRAFDDYNRYRNTNSTEFLSKLKEIIKNSLPGEKQ